MGLIMKKRFSKLLIAIPLLFGAVSLSACDFFNNLMSYFGENNEATVFVKGIKLSKNTLDAGLNNTYKLECVFNPTNATNKNVTWNSSNTSVCTVVDGEVSCVGLGTATITVTSEEGNFKDTCQVTVTNKPMLGITISKKNMSIKPGATRTLSVAFNPSDCSDKAVEWYSSDTDIVTVDQNGVVTCSATAHDGDTATVTVRATNHLLYSDTCEITVVESQAAIEKTDMNWTYSDFSKYNAYGSTYCPSLGDVKLLVIPVWFADSAQKTGINTDTKKEKVRQDIEKTYFGTEGETGWHSVKTFYENESTVDGSNLLTLSGTVSDWYNCTEDYNTFKQDNTAGNQNTANFVKKATNWYFTNHPTDNRKNYDSNHDGLIDGVMLIYAAPDYISSGDATASNYWAYCHWCKGDKNTNAPNPDVYFWASYDFMYGTRYSVGNFTGGDNSHSTVDAHTYIHEMGHVFGLEDYYDYSEQYNPSGCFSMQDHNVGGHDPYSLIALGWAKPYIPTDTMEIKIKPFQTNHDVIMLIPDMNEYGSPFDEYILLEYYTPTGLNELDTSYEYKGAVIGPNDSGIRVWHVDARVVGWVGPNKEDLDLETLGSNINFPGGHRCLGAFKNTYYSSKEETNSYASPLGVEYSEYNLLQLIRNNENATVFTASKNKPYNQTFKSADLFKQGSEFTVSKFKKQFVKGNLGHMNKGASLGYSFSVTSITPNEATIQITSI